MNDQSEGREHGLFKYQLCIHLNGLSRTTESAILTVSNVLRVRKVPNSKFYEAVAASSALYGDKTGVRKANIFTNLKQ
jgi:hypothetical protein